MTATTRPPATHGGLPGMTRAEPPTSPADAHPAGGPLLAVNDLRVWFPITGGWMRRRTGWVQIGRAHV